MSVEQKKEKILSRKISIDIFINLLYAVIFMVYYVSLNILGKFMLDENFSLYIKYSCMVFLSIGIIAFEVGYKKDKGKYWVHGIEFLVISFYTLMIRYVVRVNELEFEKYVTISSYVFSLYYILKCMIIYTKERKAYLKSLSDIKEIVKKDEPIKKEATKKKKTNIEDKSNIIKKDDNKDSKNNNSKKDKNKTSKKASNSKNNVKKNDKDKNKNKNNSSSKKDTTKKNENEKAITKQKEETKKDNKNEKQDDNEQKVIKQDTPKKRGRPKKASKTN